MCGESVVGRAFLLTSGPSTSGRSVDRAEVVWFSDVTGEEQVRLGDHDFGFGGVGDGYCYGHQSFDCIENLTPDERRALTAAEPVADDSTNGPVDASAETP